MRLYLGVQSDMHFDMRKMLELQDYVDLCCDLNCKLPDFNSDEFGNIQIHQFHVVVNETITAIQYGDIWLWDDNNDPYEFYEQIKEHILDQLRLQVKCLENLLNPESDEQD